MKSNSEVPSTDQRITPGPWAVGRTGRPSTLAIFHETSTARELVCRLADHTVAYPDVVLMAAAPDMLAALRRFVAFAKSWHEFHHGSSSIQCDALCDAIAPGEAALAKAEGRS